METVINRREALRKTALIMGTAISSSAIISFLESCKSLPDVSYKPIFFNGDQARLVSEVAEIILPKTDTPGAKEVGVPNFIDRMIADCYDEKDQKTFLKGLTAFDEGTKKMYGDRFIYCEPEQQQAYVLQTHQNAVNLAKGDKKAQRPFILKLKELAMLGYFLSEPGATQVLQYNQVPGAYHGCMPLSEAGNGRTWA
ncbi:MAG: gluconate 2-dehydrogenase subunit 3 family protein [Bacteroidetes bacterium]|nr:gluconate 2-dehydrogenase subunit 3 family protein [Bacteroidota bacterium]